MGIIYICVRVFVCGLWMEREREKRIAFRATGSDSLFCLQVLFWVNLQLAAGFVFFALLKQRMIEKCCTRLLISISITILIV